MSRAWMNPLWMIVKRYDFNAIYMAITPHIVECCKVPFVSRGPFIVLYVSVMILFVMKWLQIKFCIFEYSRGATVYKVKLFKNRLRKDNSFSKIHTQKTNKQTTITKSCRLSKLLLTLVVNAYLLYSDLIIQHGPSFLPVSKLIVYG